MERQACARLDLLLLLLPPLLINILISRSSGDGKNTPNNGRVCLLLFMIVASSSSDLLIITLPERVFFPFAILADCPQVDIGAEVGGGETMNPNPADGKRASKSSL